jgi:multiple sugar transport system substrate-binding protein
MFGLEEAKLTQEQVDRFNQETGENAIFMSIGWGNVAQKAQIAIEGGNPPDLVSLWSQAYTWGPRGLLLPLEDYAKRDGWDGTGWSKPAYDALWSEGHLWGTGHTLNMFALHVNKTLYEEGGYSADTPPTEIAELDQMAEKLTKADDAGNLTRLGFLPWQNSNLWHWGWAFGGNFYDEANDKILVGTDEGVLQALEWFVAYAQKYDIDKIDRFRSGFGRATMSSDDPWYVGKVVMQMDGSWKRSWVPRYAPELQYFVSKTPTVPGVEPVSLIEIGAMFNVPKGAKNPDGGWLLAKEFASKRCQIEFGKLVGDIPPLIEAARDPEFLNSYPYNEVFIQMAESGGRGWPRIPVLAMYQQELDRVVDAAVHGKVAPKQGLEEVAAKVQKELDDFRKQTGT